MKKYSWPVYSVASSFGVLAYVWLVVSIMTFAGQTNSPKGSFYVPIAILMLFVLSAAIVGSLVFGRPIYLVIKGKTAEAVKSALLTIGCLAVLTFVALVFVFTR